jgi:hypothetical protein
VSVPAGANKKLDEKQAARERERANAKRKHDWEKSGYDPIYDHSCGTRTEIFQCSRTGCSQMWTRRFSPIASQTPIKEGKEPIGCFSPDR